MASRRLLSRAAQQCVDDYAPEQHVGAVHHHLPRRISLSGDWECGLTEIHYPHDWYNVRNARLTVEHGDKTETDAYFEDGYYDSAKTLVRALNDELKGGRVEICIRAVTQKVTAHMKGDTTFALYGDLPTYSDSGGVTQSSR